MSDEKKVNREEVQAGKARALLWRSAEVRAEERLDRRNAVLATATELFLERGSHRVSMNDIAEQLCITKPALYNYFTSKDELLFECFRRGNTVTIAQLEEAEGSLGNGLAKLQSFIRAYAGLIATTYGSVMIRLDDRELPKTNRAEVRRYKRHIDARVRAIIAGGIADGSIQPCDLKLTAFSIFGALNWIGQWFRAGGSATPAEIGDDYAERLTAGLAAPTGPRPQREQRPLQESIT